MSAPVNPFRIDPLDLQPRCRRIAGEKPQCLQASRNVAGPKSVTAVIASCSASIRRHRPRCTHRGEARSIPAVSSKEKVERTCFLLGEAFEKRLASRDLPGQSV